MIATASASKAGHDGITAAGWYGKLPGLGDFASRRLDPGFIEAWDLWLAEGLADWQQREPTLWLERYLASPSWRFVAPAGTLPPAAGAGCWVGVLMPSVDRVGRYFPLTLALRLPAWPVAPDHTGALLSWLHDLNELALDALDGDWSAERLEAALLQRGGPAPVLAEPGAPTGAELAPLPPGQIGWMHGDAAGVLQMHTTNGLPQGTGFDTLLGARCAAP